MISHQKLERWVAKHWLAILVTALLPVWWAMIWVLATISPGVGTIAAIVLMIPLGTLSMMLNTATVLAIRDLIVLSIFGFLFGWLAQGLWNRNKWMRFSLVAILVLNSCVFLGYTLLHLD
jgi:hypothetical protein